nr:MAG TPA: hypothetical protein [Bacteriophage sp.]
MLLIVSIRSQIAINSLLCKKYPNTSITLLTINF